MNKKDLEIELAQEKRNSKRLKSENNTWFFGMLFAIVSYMNYNLHYFELIYQYFVFYRQDIDKF